MGADLHPASVDDVLAAVKWAAGERIPLEIVGTGSKRPLGRPMQTDRTLDVSALSGVTLFEPEELVLSARAGTPLAEIEKLLDDHNQEFQFEPVDLGPLLGQASGQGTLGGLVGTNIAGPRRLKAGSVRDHILGINAVSGRGEIFKSGGRVVKNVTGYDLSKGVTGAHGTLAVLTDITMKVLPRAETEQTLMVRGLDDDRAAEAMALAMGSNGEISAAAHLPATLEGDTARTVLRLEGFAPSVAYRIEKLAALMAGFGKAEFLDAESSRELWRRIKNAEFFAEPTDQPVWRISCTPGEGHRISAALADSAAIRHYFDWQGGLIWLAMADGEPHADIVRDRVAKHGGGHATLIRATAAQRLAVPVFQPQEAALAALSQRYRENFDPYGILNPGRMHG